MTDRIAASIELSPKQAVESTELRGLFPRGVRVYMTDIGTDTSRTIAAGAARLADLGYVAVPHFASRRLTSHKDLEARIRMLAEEANVGDVLVIGGGLDRPAGEFTSTMDVLETGLFDKYGIKRIGVAGHPEGSPDFSKDAAEEALRFKQEFAKRTDAEMRIVTQFGFDAPGFIRWADGLRNAGIELPVHLGVAGPAKVTTLVKFAVMCGVGASVQFIKRRAASLGTMVKGFDPEEIVKPIEAHVRDSEQTPIEQIHVFAFGGIKKAAEWLKERGSWVA
ncbi:MAG: methylenetetrahydrofolate reductase [Arenicellales bacterium]|jgi:methylenetetrahydrofolate reductase (NADPH)